jgi:hypothetical protein
MIRLIHVGFVIEKEKLVLFFSEYLDLSLTVAFHQSSIHVFISNLHFALGQTGEAWETSELVRHWTDNDFHMYEIHASNG